MNINIGKYVWFFLPRGYRNNNPVNITTPIKGGWWKGQIGVDQIDGYTGIAVFESVVWSMRAFIKIVRENYQGLDEAQFAMKYTGLSILQVKYYIDALNSLDRGIGNPYNIEDMYRLWQEVCIGENSLNGNYLFYSFLDFKVAWEYAA